MSKLDTYFQNTKFLIIRSTLLLFILLSLLFQQTATASQSEEGWEKLVDLAEAVLGEGGLLDAKDAESQIDAIVDLHAKYCADVLGKPISSQRIHSVKQGMRLFMKTAGKRYTGDKRTVMLRLIKDLVTNRAVFAELLTSSETSEVIERQMLAYLERNQNLSYKEPVSVSSQVIVPSSETDLQIVADQIRLIHDKGTSGHYNRAIDAGEVITLNIPLKNTSSKPFRSTSGFLQTKDKFVQTDVSEVIYTEKDVISGETVTFAPGKTVVPKSHFTFTISPMCPDEHEIEFEVLVWDSDHGKFTVPFTVKVYHVGPLDFGKSSIDDDIPGPSNGNDDGLADFGETIEYVLAIQNRGKIKIENITATMISPQPEVQFKKDGNVLKYSSIEPGLERPIASSFIFKFVGQEDRGLPTDVYLRLFAEGDARGYTYTWLRSNFLPIGVSGVLAEATTAVEEENFDRAIQILTDKRFSGLLDKKTQTKKLLQRAYDGKWPIIAEARKLYKENKLSEAFDKAWDAKEKYKDEKAKSDATNLQCWIMNERFIANNDNTVTDTISGLTWILQPSECFAQVIYAKEYCEKLEYGEYDDWRLPTVYEFDTIVISYYFKKQCELFGWKEIHNRIWICNKILRKDRMHVATPFFKVGQFEMEGHEYFSDSLKNLAWPVRGTFKGYRPWGYKMIRKPSWGRIVEY